MRGGPFGAMLLRSARYVPLPYRGWAYAGAVGAAAAVYAGTYIARRWQDMEARVS
jgi:hypothetical protein